MFLLPFPNAFLELLASEVEAAFFSFLLDLLFDHDLCGDAGVIGARQPEDFLAIHPSLAGEDVLDCVVQHMSHVQHPRHVGRRDDNGIARLGRGWVGDKQLLV